ncbi:hypothetical protein [Frankia sp. EAN1pec]|uniref:hypothetical protein n=1 Tax=Parafrankia sp. (strain EAN1pec) TaxID=298653 RepID=UPI000674B95B
MASVAVSVNVDALFEEAGSQRTKAGREYAARGRVGGLAVVDGALRATVTEHESGRTNIRVEVTGRDLIIDCDQHGTAAASGVCEHAVAVILAARAAGIAWPVTSAPSAYGPAAGKEERLLEKAAVALTRAELTQLVVARALEDRLFAARLLRQAGRLEPADPAELVRVRRLVREAGAIPDSNPRWDLHHLVEAGRAMLAELEIVAVRPPTAEFLDVVEEAVRVWDRLAGHLHDAWDVYETEPGEIGEPLAALHLRLCEDLRPDPVDLGRRLAALVSSAEVDSYLHAPEGYADILGDEGLSVYDTACHG